MLGLEDLALDSDIRLDTETYKRCPQAQRPGSQSNALEPKNGGW